MVYVDAHTHLNDDTLFPNWNLYLDNFQKIGGKALVNIGVDALHNQRAIDIAIQSHSQFPDLQVKASIGFHPSEICFGHISSSADIHKVINSLRALYSQYADHIVAIGECGIDMHYDGDPRLDLQQELFTAQCKLAAELDLPIVIHSRDDFATTFTVIKDYPQLKIYFHCRGYGPDEAQELQNHFPQLWIGFCGNVTYPKAQSLRDSLVLVRPESLLLETDAPYLTPQQYRGQTNEPANIQFIYEYVSSMLGVSMIALQDSILYNFRKAYNIVD